MLGHPLLRLCLYTGAETDIGAEYRDRRSGGRCSRPGRLGGCHEYHHLTGHLALRHHLLLDTATLLGALTAHPEGLREGAYSYAARGDGRGRDAQANFPLLAIAAGSDPGVVWHACYGLLLPGGGPCPGRHSGLHVATPAA